MDPLSGLRRKNAAAAPAKDGTTGLPFVLPEMQTGEHHLCAEFSNRDHKSARRKDAVLTANSVVMHCIFFILESLKKLEKLFIAPKARQILHETAHRAFARCECAQHMGFLIKYFNQESVLGGTS